MTPDETVPSHRTQGRADPAPARSQRVRLGGALLVLGAVEFVIGMVVTELGWTTPYSLRTNYISDLGAVGCGVWPAGSSRYVCSPWHLVFDVSIIAMGLLLIAAVGLFRSAFDPERAGTWGSVLFLIAGAGAIGVGLSPEDVNLAVHSASALLAFLGGNLALLVFGLGMGRWPSGGAYRAFSVLCGLVGLGALILFVAGLYGPLGVGGMERLIVAPILLWAAVVGTQLARPLRGTVPGPVATA